LEALTLEVEGVPGDTNDDELVDLVDFDTISGNFGLFPALLTDGDVAGGGAVDLLDFRLWKSNRTDLAAAAGGSIPEPTTAALALLCVGALMGFGIGAGRWAKREA
jgi:hypothetical protein